MGRKKIYNTTTEKKRAADERYREKHGERRKHGTSGKTQTKALDGYFLAWDGEGRDFDELVELPETLFQRRENFLESSQSLEDEYERSTKKHRMTLFACGSYDAYHSVYDETGLNTMQILQFLSNVIPGLKPNAIHVSFSFSYDATFILYDLPREEAIKAHSDKREKLDDYGRYGKWLIKYRPRKELYIAELNDVHEPYKRTASGKWTINKKWSVTIWDVWGFFQSSFAKALQNWSIGSSEELQQITEGKDGRSDFANWVSEKVESYNKLELKLLCQLMDAVRNTTNELDMPLRRWDGAGAVAAAMYQKELPKDYIKNIAVPRETERAAYYAYAGGRSECLQHGYHKGTIWRYDINSAYPDAMRTIPDLSDGEWIKGDIQNIEVEPFGLYHIQWNDKTGKAGEQSFLPFFWRDITGEIYYPSFGENWIWGIELMNVHNDMNWSVSEFYIFRSNSDRKPFNFIEKYYTERLEIKRRAKRGENLPNDNGRSLIIKLGLNSLYGKTVQKVGIEKMEDGSLHYPPYYNIVIGSYITAYTRAKLYRKAMLCPGAIALFATDGILSTQPLGSTESSEELGGWEVEQLDGLVLLQAGVYWLQAGGKWTEKSRGIDKAKDSQEVLKRLKDILTGWKKKKRAQNYSLRRFIATKWSSVSEERYNLRGLWITQSKEVKLRDVGKKRDTIEQGRLEEQLLPTRVAHSVSVDGGHITMSEPRKVGIVDVDELDYEEEQ